jgi:hypothetical protein
VDQLGTENGTPYFEFGQGKTVNARRKIPVHPVLVELGLLEFVKFKKSQGERRLFPECTFVKKQGYTKAASRWFGEFLDHLGITGREYVFHSFRHNVSGMLAQVDTLKHWRICRYLGHALPSSTPESERTYFKEKKLDHVLPVIENIKYKIDWTKYKTLTEKTYTK